MTEQIDAETGIAISHQPPRVSQNIVVRVLGASLVSGLCAGIGFFVGSLGDSAKKGRMHAQNVLAVVGTVFGFSIAMFASSGKDKRPYSMRNSPEILTHHFNAPLADMDGTSQVVTGVMREGTLEEEPARKMGR